VIDLELTDEQRLVRETAREFAQREILPYARDNDRAERFDESLPPKLGAIGFLGPIIAEEYGGRGIDYQTYALIVGADDHLGADVAGRVGDREVGHRGAEEEVPPGSLRR
jgi:alkylation response protein AidB-like acyl-CoA dehydrogenase